MNGVCLSVEDNISR